MNTYYRSDYFIGCMMAAAACGSVGALSAQMLTATLNCPGNRDSGFNLVVRTIRAIFSGREYFHSRHSERHRMSHHAR